MNTTIEEALSGIANQLRIDSIAATTAAGSGHPSSCCSAADIVAALFFGHMRFDPKNPRYANNDRFILSKGHAAPLLYAAWAELGLFPREHLLTLRELSSDLEGHPTPHLAFVDVATGSLGQGLGVGVGMALCARLDKLDYRTYVLMGDGETAEGSVWEAASLAGINQLSNLVGDCGCAIASTKARPTAFGHDTEVYRKRFESFNWRTEVINGHDMEEILEVLGAAGLGDQPLAIIARTNKGHGVSIMEDKDGWHGKALSKDEAAAAIARTCNPRRKPAARTRWKHRADLPLPANATPASYPPTTYKMGEVIATREAFGNALARIGEVDERIVAMDGDTKNSTFSDKFYKKFPDALHGMFYRGTKHGGRGDGISATRQGAVRLDVRVLFEPRV